MALRSECAGRVIEVPDGFGGCLENGQVRLPQRALDLTWASVVAKHQLHEGGVYRGKVEADADGRWALLLDDGPEDVTDPVSKTVWTEVVSLRREKSGDA